MRTFLVLLSRDLRLALRSSGDVAAVLAFFVITVVLFPLGVGPETVLLGRIAAGGPMLAEENVEDVLVVPETLGRGADFLLTIHGDSMIEAGILDGDTIVVQRRDEARNGEIVVALAGDDESADEATVKTFYREADGRIRLQPENATLEPIYADHVKILGKVVGVFRSLQ